MTDVTPELEAMARALVRSRHRTCCKDRDFSNYTLSPFDIDDARAALLALLPVGEGVVDLMWDTATEGCGIDDIPGNQDFAAAFSAAIQHIAGGNHE